MSWIKIDHLGAHDVLLLLVQASTDGAPTFVRIGSLLLRKGNRGLGCFDRGFLKSFSSFRAGRRHCHTAETLRGRLQRGIRALVSLAQLADYAARDLDRS